MSHLKYSTFDLHNWPPVHKPCPLRAYFCWLDYSFSLLITIDFYNQDCFLYILGIFLHFECSKLLPLFEAFDQVIFISFYFVVRATQVTQQALSSDNVGKSLDSSLMHSIFLKSLVNNLKIFSTTQLVGNVSPFLPSWFTIVSIQEIYSTILLAFFILILSSSPLRIWSLTYFYTIIFFI